MRTRSKKRSVGARAGSGAIEGRTGRSRTLWPPIDGGTGSDRGTNGSDRVKDGLRSTEEGFRSVEERLPIDGASDPDPWRNGRERRRNELRSVAGRLPIAGGSASDRRRVPLDRWRVACDYGSLRTARETAGHPRGCPRVDLEGSRTSGTDVPPTSPLRSGHRLPKLPNVHILWRTRCSFLSSNSAPASSHVPATLPVAWRPSPGAGSQAHGATLSSFSQAHGATPFAA